MAGTQSVGSEKLSAKSQNSFPKACGTGGWGGGRRLARENDAAWTQRQPLVLANGDPGGAVLGEKFDY